MDETIRIAENVTLVGTLTIRRGPKWLAANGYPPDAEVIETRETILGVVELPVVPGGPHYSEGD